MLRHVDRLLHVILHGSTDKVECKDDDLLMHIGNAEAEFVHEHVHLEQLTRDGLKDEANDTGIQLDLVLAK